MERLEIESVELPLLEERPIGRDKLHALIQNPRKSLWIAVHILVILDAFFVFYYLLLLTQKVVPGRVALALVSFFGGLVATYGLYGQKWRGHALLLYSVAFHIVPGIVVFCSFIIFVSNQEAAIAEYKKHFPHVNSTMFTIQLVLQAVVAISYHVGSAWIVLKYKNVQRKADETF